MRNLFMMIAGIGWQQVRQVLFLLLCTTSSFVLQAQTATCNNIDTARIGQGDILISDTQDPQKINKADKISLYHNNQTREFRLVAGTAKKETLMTFRYQLRPPDEYYNLSCYLLFERIDTANNRKRSSLKGFNRMEELPDSVKLQWEEENPEKEFEYLRNMWDFKMKDVPCRVQLSLVALMPRHAAEPDDYYFLIFTCLPVKTKLVKDEW